jgi:hypothetical protein
MTEHAAPFTLTFMKDPDGQLMRGHCECGQAFYPPFVSAEYDLAFIKDRFEEHRRTQSTPKEKTVKKKPVIPPV